VKRVLELDSGYSHDRKDAGLILESSPSFIFSVVFSMDILFYAILFISYNRPTVVYKYSLR